MSSARSRWVGRHVPLGPLAAVAELAQQAGADDDHRAADAEFGNQQGFFKPRMNRCGHNRGQRGSPSYHCDPKQPLPFLSLVSRKNYMTISFMGIYGDAEGEKSRGVGEDGQAPRHGAGAHPLQGIGRPSA